MGKQSRRASGIVPSARDAAHGFTYGFAASATASLTCDFTQPLNAIIITIAKTKIRIVQFLPLFDI